MMWRKILAAILVIGGLSIIAYPTAHDKYLEYRQQKLIEEWQADLNNLILVEDNDSVEQQSMIQDTATDKQQTAIDLKKEMTGLLIIDKISLSIPILPGINTRNLSLAAASIDNGVEPGENGNYIVAAHRSHTYGIMFNRLDELTKGDKVMIETSDATYTYDVTEVKVIVLTDEEVLKNSDEKTVTLITCDYSVPKPYLRLVVRGKMP